MKEQLNREDSKKLQVGDIVEGTFGKMQLVEDFLPLPEELLKNEKLPTARINMPVETELLNWFKAEAKRVDGSYQRMIKNLMREYRDQIEEMRAKNKNLGT